jgi:hypothetical protein
MTSVGPPDHDAAADGTGLNFTNQHVGAGSRSCEPEIGGGVVAGRDQIAGAPQLDDIRSSSGAALLMINGITVASKKIADHTASARQPTLSSDFIHISRQWFVRNNLGFGALTCAFC